MNNINKLTFLSILWVSIFFTSCNGQVKTNLPKENINQRPKMIRTQGVMSGNVGCELQDKTATFGSAQEVLA